jgi:hypothetical protein
MCADDSTKEKPDYKKLSGTVILLKVKEHTIE